MKNKIGCIALMFLLVCVSGALAVCPNSMLGDGSSGNPCQITDWNNLQAMNQALSYSYILMNDLDSGTSGFSLYQSGSGFAPVGNDSVYFTGTFNGKNHTITGLYINRPSGSGYNIGLFGFTQGAYISNIGLVNVNILGYDYVGGLCGFSLYSTISNSYSTGTIISQDQYGGGLAGFFDNGNVSNSYSTANVNAAGYFAGGLFGQINFCNIKNCYSTGIITGYKDMGGLAGYSFSNTISNFYFTGTLNGGLRIGGITGISYSDNISNSYSAGTVTGSDSLGGLIGYSVASTTISNSFSSTKVTGNTQVGGLIGYIESTDVNGTFWDIYQSGQSSCTSLGTPSGCTGVDGDGNSLDYFYFLSNPPLSSWNIYTWQENVNNYPTLKECVPDCAGKTCGDDGCGGSCESCSVGQKCISGLCTTICTPNCAGKNCGSDGCGGSCGSCSVGQNCISGLCTTICTPNCNGKVCGSDGCSGSCGPNTQSCSVAFGTCSVTGTKTCNGNGQYGNCQTTYPDPRIANCAGKSCGSNGCGGTCGTCSVGQICTNSVCITVCAPITGNSVVDSACCVKNNIYTSSDRKSTHGAYVSCVTDMVSKLKKAGTISSNEGGNILKAAAGSSVDMPASSNKVTGNAIESVPAETTWLGLISITSIIALVIVSVTAFNKIKK